MFARVGESDSILGHLDCGEEGEAEEAPEPLEAGSAPAATSKSPTCGRVKLPHLRMRDEGAGMLRRRWPLRYSRRRFLQAPALAVTLQQVSVVEQTVE